MESQRVPIGWLALSVVIGLNVGTYKTIAQDAALSKEKIRALLVKAGAGDTNAEIVLGTLYWDGSEGVQKDYRRAAYWFRKAADQGNAKAQEELGFLYDRGDGVSQDYAQAASWFRKAAKQGDAIAQRFLGDYYALGHGLPVDYVQAATWFRKAADQDDASAQSNLAHLYEVGYGVPQDSTQAAIWYRKAADQGDEYARKRIAAIQATEAKEQNPMPIASGGDIARMAFKSVVLLEMDDANGQPLSLGSGFFVADGVITTNAHVIEGAASGTAKIIGGEKRLPIVGTVAVDRHSDLALLKVDSSAPALNLGPDAKLAVGDKVYVVGNPLGLEGTFSEGIVSGIRSIESDSILQMTAPISPGSSGGPVINDSGAVIGVAEATFKDGQNLNLAVPVTYLSKMLTAASQQLTVMPLTQRASTAPSPSVVDAIGTRIESGIATSDFKLEHFDAGFGGDKAGFDLRIRNKLPLTVSNVKLRIIYRDASNAIMDFEDFTSFTPIPPGLTKTVAMERSEEALRAARYYKARNISGSLLPPPTGDNFYNSGVQTMEPRVEVRVVGFDTGKPK